MNKNINKLQIIILTAVFVLFIFQSVLVYGDKNLKSQKEIENSYTKNKEISLEDVYNKLKTIKNKQIINAEKVNDGCSVTFRINCDNKCLANEMKKLEDCFITNYTIMHNKDENCLELKVFFEN